MKKTYAEVRSYATKHKCDWRTAAMCLALGRISKAYGERGIFP